MPFAGTDDTSRSHFETQDSIELGQDLNGTRDFRSGFMSRLAACCRNAVTPIAFTGQIPLIFRGQTIIPNMSLNIGGKTRHRFPPGGTDFPDVPGSDLAPAVAQGFQVEDEVYKSIATEMQAASRGADIGKRF